MNITVRATASFMILLYVGTIIEEKNSSTWFLKMEPARVLLVWSDTRTRLHAMTSLHLQQMEETSLFIYSVNFRTDKSFLDFSVNFKDLVFDFSSD